MGWCSHPNIISAGQRFRRDRQCEIMSGRIRLRVPLEIESRVHFLLYYAVSGVERRVRQALGRVRPARPVRPNGTIRSRIGTWVPQDWAPDLGAFHRPLVRVRGAIRNWWLLPCKACNGLASARPAECRCWCALPATCCLRCALPDPRACLLAACYLPRSTAAHCVHGRCAAAPCVVCAQRVRAQLTGRCPLFAQGHSMPSRVA